MAKVQLNQSGQRKLNNNYQHYLGFPEGTGKRNAPGQTSKTKPTWESYITELRQFLEPGKDKEGKITQAELLEAYTAKRAHQAGITGPRYFIAQDGTKSQEVPQLEPTRIFQDSKDAVSILYANWNGRPYRNPETAQDKGAPRFFTRYRIAPWHVTETQKYHQHKGTGVHIYGNALYWHFTRKGRETPVIVFCEGEMKAETLCANNIPAVAIAGISALSKSAKKEAATMLDQLKPSRVVMLFDQDALANARKQNRAKAFANSAWKFFGFAQECDTAGRVLIPDDQLAGKGIDDVINEATESDRAAILRAIAHDSESSYFERYTGDHKSRLFAQIMASAAGPNGFNTSREPDQVARVRQWISEAQSTITQTVKQHGRVLMQAPTGAGKTTAALEIAKDWPGRVILVEPLQVIVTSEAESRKDVAILTGNVNRDDVDAARHAKLAIVTADQFWKVWPTMAAGDLLVYDEAHYLPSNHDWKSRNNADNINALTLAVDRHPHVLAMTATPPAIRYDHFYRLNIERPRAVKPELTPIIGRDRITETARQIVEYAKAGIVIDRLQSKKKLEDLAAEVERIAPELAGQIHILTSDNKAKSPIYKALAATGELPPDCRVLLTTSLADCGVSIRNENVSAVIVTDSAQDRISADTFRQFVARVRAVNFPVVFIGADRTARTVNASHEYGKIERKCKAAADVMDAQLAAAAHFDVELPELDDIYRYGTMYDPERGQYVPNPDFIFCELNQKVCAGVNNDQLLEDLSADFLIQNERQAAPDSVEVKDARKARNASRKEDRALARDMIAEYGMGAIDSDLPAYDIAVDDWKREGLRIEAKRAQKLAAYDVPAGDIGALLDVHQQPRAWSRLIKRVALEYADTVDDRLDLPARAAALEFAGIRRTLSLFVGKEFTSEDARTQLETAGITGRTPQQAAELASTFFEIVEVERSGPSRARTYEMRERERIVPLLENMTVSADLDPPF